MAEMSTQELAGLRSELKVWFTDTVTISRYTKAPDQYGGETQTPATVATNVPCDIATTASALFPAQMIASQDEVRQIFTIALPIDTDVKVGDEVTITSWTPNQTVHCQSVMTPESIELELRIICSLEGEHRG